MAEVNLDGIISMGTLQNLVRAFTIPTDTLGAVAKNAPAGITIAIAGPIQRWIGLLEQHVAEVEGEPHATSDTAKKAALELVGTSQPTLQAVQELDAELLRTYADSARAFLRTVDPILREMDGNPNLMQGAIEEGIGSVAGGLAPTLDNVQNVYVQSVRSFVQALKLVAGAVPAVAAGLTSAVAPRTVVPEKINIA